MTNFATAALAYVRYVLGEMKISPTALAKRAGISSTTLTRALNDRKHKFSLSVTTLQKIYQASGISPARFLNAQELEEPDRLRPTPFEWGVRTVALSKGLAEPTSIFSKGFRGGTDFSQGSRDLGVTPVAGTIAVGRWRELTLLDIGRYGAVSLRHSFYEPGECFVCIVGDDSINRKARKGELLYCVRLDAANINLRDNSIVIVERRSEDGLKIELTARKVLTSVNGLSLHFESTDANFKEVLEVPLLAAPKLLRLIGLVEYVFRPIVSPLSERLARGRK
jgi:transcriptional regulator with XRE-family HTH domain